MLFPNFPYSQWPSSDESLNKLVAKHGGWLALLDPATDVDSLVEFKTELANAGYCSDEIAALKAMFAQGTRAQMLLRAAVLHRKSQLGLANALDLRLLQQVDAALPALQITPEELKDSMEHLAPHVMRWFPQP